MKFFYLLILVFISCCSCQTRDFDSVAELRQFIRQDKYGLTKAAKPRGYSVRVTCLPTDMMVFQELNSLDVPQSELDRLRKKYNEHYYFLMEISRDDREALMMNNDSEVYGDLVSTLSFRMGDYVNMTSSRKDTVALEDFILDRTYGLANSTNLMFVFEKKELPPDQQLALHLGEFGLNIGQQHFQFAKKDIDQMPTLKFSIN